MEKRPNIFLQALWSIINPKKLFESVKEKPMIALPIILMIVSSIALGIVAYNAAADIDYSSLSGIDAQSAELAGQIMKNPVMAVIQILTLAVTNISGLFIKGLFLWLLIRMVGGKGTYLQSTSVVGLSWTPLFIRNCLQAISGVGQNVNNQLASLDFSQIDFAFMFQSTFAQEGIIFIIWNIILLTIGFSIVFGVSKIKAALVCTLYWVVHFFGKVAMSWVSVQNAIKMQSMMPNK